MLNSPQYKHIIWDWNGTLLDDAWLFVDVMNNILTKRQMANISVEKYREIFGFPIKNYYKKLGFKLNNESFEKVGMEFINEYKKRRYEANLHKMAVITLSKLQSMNIRHSILSAGHQNLVDDLINYYKVEKFFTDVNGLNDYYANSKKEKALEWLKKVRFDSNEILFIGDTDHDFEVAQSIGVDCILISHGHNCYNRLIKTGAPIIDHLSDIIKIIK